MVQADGHRPFQNAAYVFLRGEARNPVHVHTIGVLLVTDLCEVVRSAWPSLLSVASFVISVHEQDAQKVSVPVANTSG